MVGSFGTGPVNRQEMCISCYKPETSTAMIVHGDIDWLAAALHRFAGVPMSEAMGTAEEIYRDTLATPEPRNMSIIRLCRSCAKKTGVPVHNMDLIVGGAQLAAVIQPDNI
jgi:hypothetical protein